MLTLTPPHNQTKGYHAFNVEFNKPLTVNELVKYILNQGLCGTIYIDNLPYVHYTFNKLQDNIDPTNLHKTITNITAEGSETHMTYKIKTT